MTTVYRHPYELDPAPEMVFTDDHRFDSDATMANEAAWVARLAEWVKSQPRGKGDLVGKVIAIGVADGAAQYMIASHKPTSLIHLPLGDAYNVPDYQLRGLRISDLRKMAFDFG